MAVKWTKEQRQVIDLRDRNILVSAAAGSGKTAVLVERIISMITDEKNPVDVDKLLVVTYTEAAAAEMKEKDSNSYEAAIENIIDNALIPMKAVLGTSKINVQDFVNLQLGDVIRLDRKVDDELEVYVGNIKKFKALPGYSDNKYAVRVTEILREESE